MSDVCALDEAASTYDVVVLGGGGAGLATAVAAARAGATVAVLEKRKLLGGTTQLAVGSITGAATRLQNVAGIIDDASTFHSDMDAFTADLLPLDNPRLRALLANEAGPTIDWLESLGVAFAGPYPEPPHRINRMHNAIPGARMIVARLERAARRAGVIFFMEMEPTHLLHAPDGAVIGVVARGHDGKICRFRALRGVVLATGDFSGNETLRQRWLSPTAIHATPINPNNLGEGHMLAVQAGSALCNMDRIFGPQIRFPRAPTKGLAERFPTWPWLARLAAWYFMRAPTWALKPFVTSLLIANMSPSEELFRAGVLLLDSSGRTLDTTDPATAVATAEGGQAFIVLDKPLTEVFSHPPHFVSTAPGIAYATLNDYLLARPDIARRFASVVDMATALNIPTATLLQATTKLVQGPLVVLGPVQAMLTTTEGSVAIDEQCRVLNTYGQPILGLFAAGCTGQGGLLLRGHGLHLAWAFTSGRIAGTAVAAQRSNNEKADALTTALLSSNLSGINKQA